MLSEIQVSQFALIEHLKIPFYRGLNIISGETGAGKSILIKSLGLLMGGKSQSIDIREGFDKATIEGCFDLSHRSDVLEKLKSIDIDCSDDQLIVRRVLQRSGKNRIYINGHLTSLSDLKNIICPLITLSRPDEAPLIEMTGQHENKNLTSLDYQMEILDQFAGNKKLRDQCKKAYEKISSLKKKLEQWDGDALLREQRIDFLKYQLTEITDIAPLAGEDDKLEEQIRKLRSLRSHQEWLVLADESLCSGEDSMALRLGRLLSNRPQDPPQNWKNLLNSLEQIKILVDDFSFEVSALQASDNQEDESLNQDHLENRLSRIRKIQKKFGKDIDQILSEQKKMTFELNELTQFEEKKQEYLQNIKEITKTYKKHALSLRSNREKASLKMSKMVNTELKDLNMKGLLFSVKIEPTEDIGPRGMEHVEFMVKNSPKGKARSMGKTASGGELSRILLSLKQVLGQNTSPRTFLFDEVDTGISGETAEKVGAKLGQLAKNQQVLCVTHLPQVASFGNTHFSIEKSHTKKGQGVQMDIQELDGDHRIREIARLLSGEKISKTSLAHAKELLKTAQIH